MILGFAKSKQKEKIMSKLKIKIRILVEGEVGVKIRKIIKWVSITILVCGDLILMIFENYLPL